MKFILQLAAKNLMRYKRRTAITAVAIAFGLMMYVFVDSLLLGAELESMRNLRWYETASLKGPRFRLLGGPLFPPLGCIDRESSTNSRPAQG